MRLPKPRDASDFVGWADQREAHHKVPARHPASAPLGGLPVGQPTLRAGSLALFAALIFFCGIDAIAAQDAAPALQKKYQVAVPYDGPELFARLLDHAGLKPLASLDQFEVAAPADKTVLIVFGNPQPLLEFEKKAGGVGGFLKRGGALLLATDRAYSLGQLPSLGWPDVTFEKGGLVNDDQNFENERSCPIISGNEIGLPQHPLFRDVTKPIATNCPGSIEPRSRDLQTLAVLPFGTTMMFRPGDRRAFFKLPRPYLVATKADSPRALLVAGHGVFMNCMTVRDDIDNRRLALNAIHWLKDGKRTHVMFLNETQPVANFKMPLVGPPKMPMPSMQAINRLIDAIQNEQILQKIIDRTIGPERIVNGAIYLFTFCLIAYGLKKYFQSRWNLEATPAIVGVPPPKASALVKQQVREMVLREQLGEPAQALARDWFRTYAEIDFPAGQPPPELSFEIHAGIMQRRKLAKHVETLWRLASDPVPPDWDAKKLRALAVFLEDLALSVAAGEVVFETTVVATRRS